MTKFIKFFIRDERGAAAAEYALILAVIAGGIAVSAAALGTKIDDVIKEVTNEITTTPAG